MVPAGTQRGVAMECAHCHMTLEEGEGNYCPGCGEGPLCMDCAGLHFCDNEEYELFEDELNL